VTDHLCCSSLSDCSGFDVVPGNSPSIWSVPETDTGGLVEYTKALERRVLKELGKLPPYLRKKEALLVGNHLQGAQARG
jgi:hypothetical protein